MNTTSYRVGLDIGSTTLKIVALSNDDQRVVFDTYTRHMTNVKGCLYELFKHLAEVLHDAPFSLAVTGSVGLGFAEAMHIPFVQEVVAACGYLRQMRMNAATMIDIGGEDSKIVFLEEGKATDLRMNGNCAGGTGAFIDQMAVLLGVSGEELSNLAEKAERVYPIASRCGVFCKTDIQNLIAGNINKADIAASIYHAVVVQTIITLAHGKKLRAPIFLCGGPLTFSATLRKAFAEYLGMTEADFILPEKSALIPAWGTALASETYITTAPSFIEKLEKWVTSVADNSGFLPSFFRTSTEYKQWKENKKCHAVPESTHENGVVNVTLGIDSGSTTTKIVVLDEDNRLLYTYYQDNKGNPIQAAEIGLRHFMEECNKRGLVPLVIGSCSTGYGGELLKAAFRLDLNVVETMAHYKAALYVHPDVSFILDIGGQDMKAIFVEDGVINRIEVNEACSSGCGSFISTFAGSLNCKVQDFAQAACLAEHPCNLGTRCTVFMNSKVKQALREGASTADIAAGLSYSVVKNCLFKVLRLKNYDSLGPNIVVQGGTMLNDSIVRGLELLTGKNVYRSNIPELMGAFGCALYAAEARTNGVGIPLSEMIKKATYTTYQQNCKGCENRCAITRYRFDDNTSYYSGNRCEKIFTSRGKHAEKGEDAYQYKRKLLFPQESPLQQPLMTIGIPRCLNMYEEYPFWHALFASCNIQVLLSNNSRYAEYERHACNVMADNICFPAKVVHSHIADLQQKKVNRIFMPFVVFEKETKGMQNSFNCPIVSGYSQVIKSVQESHIPIDSPTFSFRDETALYRQCKDYLISLGVAKHVCVHAVDRAFYAQAEYERNIALRNDELLNGAKKKGKQVILLAGRPYHSDSLIQHNVSEMIAAQGAWVISDDIVRNKNVHLSKDVSFLTQWAYCNRILQAAEWVGRQGVDVQFVQLTSFGCGPDAFLTDEVSEILKQHGKTLTLLKIDDVNNIGSLKLRIRSLLASMCKTTVSHEEMRLQNNRKYPCVPNIRGKKIIVPFFTPFISPLLPDLMRMDGYDVECLPMSTSSSCEYGLRYSNNEVCYPATLIVGDVIHAFRSGQYSPNDTCVGITQTGGQCRASNYLGLLKRALKENGFEQVPLVSLSFGSHFNNCIKMDVNWFKMIPAVTDTVIFADSLSKLYHATVVREKSPGKAEQLKEFYLMRARRCLATEQTSELYNLLEAAARDFDNIANDDTLHRVGIVGEIFLKFHPFAQKNLTEWLIQHRIEVIPPMLSDFFLQSFVNTIENKRTCVRKSLVPEWLIKKLHQQVQQRLNHANVCCSQFRHFTPFGNIFDKAAMAKRVITLSAQFGEGWLIAGEILDLGKEGVYDIISLQPFGCIANHIAQRGIENKIKMLYPQLNVLSLDFDSSVSELNVINRLLLFISNFKSLPV